MSQSTYFISSKPQSSPLGGQQAEPGTTWCTGRPRPGSLPPSQDGRGLWLGPPAGFGPEEALPPSATSNASLTPPLVRRLEPPSLSCCQLMAGGDRGEPGFHPQPSASPREYSPVRGLSYPRARRRPGPRLRRGLWLGPPAGFQYIVLFS